MPIKAGRRSIDEELVRSLALELKPLRQGRPRAPGDQPSTRGWLRDVVEGVGWTEAAAPVPEVGAFLAGFGEPSSGIVAGA